METVQSVWQQLNWVDLILGVGLIGALIVGAAMGFYRQLAIIGSLTIGFVLASQFTAALAQSSMLTPVHARYGDSGTQFVAYGLLILGPLLLGLLSILIFRSFFGRTLKALDSVLGAGLGVVVGSLLFGLSILGLFQWQDTWAHEPIRGSLIGSRLADGARVASGVFPQEFRDRVERSFQERISTLATSPEEPADDEDQAPAK